MSSNHHVTSTLNAWRAQVAQLRSQFFDEARALFLARCISDLEQALELDAGAELTLAEAARESGYSADHLGRRIREGTIPNAGRPNAPRILRSDLPRKAMTDLRDGHTSTQFELASKEQIARSIVHQQ